MSIDDLKFSGRREYNFVVMNDLFGPYISCHNLSLLWKVFIKGDSKLVGITDIKWVNQSEIEDDPILIYFLFLNWNNIPIVNPIISVSIMIVLFRFDIINVWSGDNSHVSHEPEVIPNILSIMIGVMEFIDLWLDMKGLDLISCLLECKDIRIVYEAVIPIDRVIRMSIVMLILDEIILSIIESFEKNPDMKGIPIKAILFTPKIDKVRGRWDRLIPIIRISW